MSSSNLMNSLFRKICGILILQKIVALVKNNSTRWIIKNWFTSGELHFTKWYDWGFISNLNNQRIMGLIIIASFTAITFPIGIWLGSYKTSLTVPISLIFSTVISFFTFPLTLWTMHKVLDEFPINQTTITGALIIEASKFILLYGSWLLYKGGTQ